MRSPTRREQTSDKDQQDRRWSSVLAEANQEHQPQDPWYRAAGVSLAWAGGLAGAAAVLATIVLLIADLFSAERLFTARNLSDWMFWAAALLMVLGLIVPSITDAEGSFGKVGEDKDEQEGESRLSRTLRRRLRRVYNPWRWRLWASAAFAFVLSVITGLLS